MLLHDPASKTDPKLVRTHFASIGVKTNHGRPWIHLIHHGPDSGEATTFPHIVFSALLRWSHI